MGGIKISYIVFWFVSFLYLLTWLSLSFVQVELGIIILKRKRLWNPRQRIRSFLKFFEGLHNRGKFCFAKFNLFHLNPGFSPPPGQPRFICPHHFASPIRLFILPSYRRKLQNVWGWDSDKTYGEEKESFLGKSFFGKYCFR